MNINKLAIALIVSFVHLSGALSLYSQWTVQRNGADANLRDVFASDTNTAWAVGTNGTILHTSDGGDSWSLQKSGGVEHFSSVKFANKETGWTVGTEGIVLKTTDRGLSWFKQQSYTREMLLDVEVIDSVNAWIVGDLIMNTTDGGYSWRHNSISNMSKTSPATSVCFIDRKHGWILRGVLVYRTTNNGGSWEEIGTGQTRTLSRICFVDSDHGWAVGDRATILKWGWIPGTRNIPGKWGWSNQGASDEGSNGFDVNMGFLDVYFSDTLTGWVVGGNSVCRVYNTTDGGESWELVFEGDASISPSSLRGVSLSSKWAGWAVGGNGLILRYAKNEATSVEIDETLVENESSEYFDLQGRKVLPSYGQIHIRRTGRNPRASLEMWLSP
ncbi:MAG: hypothetical protein IPG73_01835 [Ignavibacteria bacterium]|nr:hypothetical protein [Ignavibacteria bacterium]